MTTSIVILQCSTLESPVKFDRLQLPQTFEPRAGVTVVQFYPLSQQVLRMGVLESTICTVYLMARAPLNWIFISLETRDHYKDEWSRDP